MHRGNKCWNVPKVFFPKQLQMTFLDVHFSCMSPRDFFPPRLFEGKKSSLANSKYKYSVLNEKNDSSYTQVNFLKLFMVRSDE